MKTFKSKSLSHLSDKDIENMCGTTQFISFESAIQLFRDYYKLMSLENKPIGYRVTEQGIEIIYK